jgi:hypothetical protein
MWIEKQNVLSVMVFFKLAGIEIYIPPPEARCAPEMVILISSPLYR